MRRAGAQSIDRGASGRFRSAVGRVTGGRRPRGEGTRYGATTRPRRGRGRERTGRARSFQARMEEFGRTAESADAAARDAGGGRGRRPSRLRGARRALWPRRRTRARAVMLDEQLRDLRQQVERGDPFVLVDGDDDDRVAGPRRRRAAGPRGARAAPSFATILFTLLSFRWRRCPRATSGLAQAQASYARGPFSRVTVLGRGRSPCPPRLLVC